MILWYHRNMLQFFINSVILLGSAFLPIGALFWKHFARRPSESIRAVIATVACIIGMGLFFLQVAIMTVEQNQNVITVLKAWLESL